MPRPRYGLNRNLLHVRDEKASGTNGGGFTSGAWQIRDLNTVLINEIQGAALSVNTITGLKAGVYEVDGSAPAFTVHNHQARLYDVTGATVLLFGTTEWTLASGITAVTRSLLRGRFTLSATSTLRLEHRCTTTRAADGFGPSASYGNVEVYSDLQIRFLGT